MRLTALSGSAAWVILTACGPSIVVQTVSGPATDISTLQTFRMLPTPVSRDDVALDANDPMLVNSLTNRELRRHIVAGFIGRGYRVDEERPDFVVAFYASTRPTLDVTNWNYGYPFRPRWWRGWELRPGPIVTEYTEGTVIIDVLEPKTKELLWRGRGIAMVSDDVNVYVKELCATVHAILDEFPLAAAVVARHATPGGRHAIH
jgi:hypothetical protein